MENWVSILFIFFWRELSGHAARPEKVGAEDEWEAWVGSGRSVHSFGLRGTGTRDGTALWTVRKYLGEGEKKREMWIAVRAVAGAAQNRWDAGLLMLCEWAHEEPQRG